MSAIKLRPNQVIYATWIQVLLHVLQHFELCAAGQYVPTVVVKTAVFYDGYIISVTTPHSLSISANICPSLIVIFFSLI
jgi:hypothetical protein